MVLIAGLDMRIIVDGLDSSSRHGITIRPRYDLVVDADVQKPTKQQANGITVDGLDSWSRHKFLADGLDIWPRHEIMLMVLIVRLDMGLLSVRDMT